MNTRTIAVIAICALLFVSSIDCKKPAKGEGKKGGKEVQAKGAKEAKVKKVKAEKVVVVEEPAHVEPEVFIVEEVAHEEAHHQVEQETVAQKHRISPPKSLKVTSAYDQCKLDCRKQRDAVHAVDYVEQLRAELAAAEAALETENAHAAHQEPVAAQQNAH